MFLQLTLASGLLFFSAPTDDWPQYNGAASDRIVTTSLGSTSFPEGGPKVAWRIPMEAGFSSFVIADGRAFTLDRRRLDDERREVCLAVEVDSGKEIWAVPLAKAKYDGGGGAGTKDNSGGDGPRSTPSVVDGRVHVYDAQMVLHTLDAKSGKELWHIDLQADHGGRSISWQNATSPLVDGGKVFVTGGGEGESLLAFDAKTGKLAWAVGDERMTHATPIVAEIHGARQVIFFVQSGLVALDVKSGEELWRIKFPFRTSSAASPVVHGDIVYVSAGYGVGGAAIRVSKKGRTFSAEYLWHKRNKRMNHWSTPVIQDGYIYGMFSFKKYGEGPLKCVELETGDIKWSQDGFGPGNVILVGEHLVALGDAGQVVLVDADPEAYHERARAEVLGGKCWSSPAFADGYVFVRSTSEGVCLDLRK